MFAIFGVIGYIILFFVIFFVIIILIGLLKLSRLMGGFGNVRSTFFGGKRHAYQSGSNASGSRGGYRQEASSASSGGNRTSSGGGKPSGKMFSSSEGEYVDFEEIKE